MESGLYIHIPFCHSKCSYCDFFSVPGLNSFHERYVAALIHEIEIRREETPLPYTTIYIGGGTPSCISKSSLEALLVGIRAIGLSSTKEYTIEVNPEDVTTELVNMLKEYGINRISMGIQSFDDDCLKLINRRHNAQCARDAIATIKDAGLNFSCDLIYGLPTAHGDSPLSSFKRSLSELLSFDPPHVSAYLLSYESGTRICVQRDSGLIKEVNDDMVVELYAHLCDTLQTAGYHHYEISNFAKPGMEAKHNSNYWNMTPYLGVGCSAHSFDGKCRKYNPNNIHKYIASINADTPFYVLEDSSETERYNDLIITSLRTSSGLDLNLVKSTFSSEIFSYFEGNIKPLLTSEQLSKSGDIITIPEQQWLISDSILLKLIMVKP